MNEIPPFEVQPQHVERNQWDSEHTRIVPTINPDGSRSAAIFRHRRFIGVLTPADAIRVANELVDTIEGNRA